MTDAWMQGPLTSAAYGWRLERSDGVTLGFTSHDKDVELDGLLLRASPGMVPSSITETIGLDIDGLDVRGALSADAICAKDLSAGRWDRAKLSIFLFDWTNPIAGKRMLAVGELGAISHGGDGFEAEFRGPAARLDCSVAPSTSPGCRTKFCDADCGLNAARFMHAATLIAANDSNLTMALSDPLFVPDFAFGKLRWLDGENSGLWSEILTGNATAVHLAMPPPFPVVAGVTVELMQGCDKTIATCANRFGNAINFRGEPFLPGNDILTRYPGAS